MGKKVLALIMVVFVGLLFLTTGMLTAAEEAKTKAPKDGIVLKSPFPNPKQGPVKFNHEEHASKFKIACTECHHLFKDGKNVWKEGDPVQPCSACHKEQKAGDVDTYQNAYHKNCKDCHKELEKQGKPTGPWKKCTECHEKKAS